MPSHRNHLFRWRRLQRIKGDERLQTIVTVDSPHQAAWAAIPWTQGMDSLDPTRAAAPSHLRMERFLLTFKKSMFCWSLWSRLFFAILCRLQGWGNPCSDLKNANRIDQMILLHNCYCIGILEHDSQPSQLQSSTAEDHLCVSAIVASVLAGSKGSGSSTVEFDKPMRCYERLAVDQPKETRSCHQPKSKNMFKAKLEWLE